MLQTNRLYRWIGKLFIAGLLSSVYATQTFALSWMNRDSYRAGNQGVGIDYFLSVHNANALGYGGIQFNINHFFNDPINFSYGAGYRRFVTPYVQAGMYCFVDSLADSVVDAAFSNINIGFEATYYRWLGDVNIYYPMDARSPASSNLSTLYMEDNPRFGIDVKIGQLLFTQYSIKGGVYYFSHEKEELSTLGGGIHFSYPVTRRSTVDIKWICDTSLQNKWVISWQFNRSSPHDQTNSALWRPIDRPVSPFSVRRIKSDSVLLSSIESDSAFSTKDKFILKTAVLDQKTIDNEIISKGYKAIVFKEPHYLIEGPINIKDLWLCGIPRKGSGRYDAHQVNIPVLTGETITMGMPGLVSKITNLGMQLSPIGKAPIGFIIDKGAEVSIENSKLHVKSYLPQDVKQYIGIQIREGATLTLNNNPYMSVLNSGLASKANLYLMDIEKKANIQGSGNGDFSLLSSSCQDKLRFYSKLPQKKLTVKGLGIAQALGPYRYISDGTLKKRRKYIAEISGEKDVRVAEKLRIDCASEINDLRGDFSAYHAYNDEKRASLPPEQLRTKYENIQTLLALGEKELPQEIKSLEKAVNAAYEKVFYEWRQAKDITSSFKGELPHSIEDFKQEDIHWFRWKIDNLKTLSKNIEDDIEIIDRYLCAKANEKWIERTKKELAKTYKAWEDFLKREKIT